MPEGKVHSLSTSRICTKNIWWSWLTTTTTMHNCIFRQSLLADAAGLIQANLLLSWSCIFCIECIYGKGAQLVCQTKNPYKNPLKVSTLQPVIFLIAFGKLLNYLGPHMAIHEKHASLTAKDGVVDTGTPQSLPLLCCHCHKTGVHFKIET